MYDIEGGYEFDLAEDGSFMAYKYEILSDDEVRFYGTHYAKISEDKEKAFNISMKVYLKEKLPEDSSQEEVLEAGWKEIDLEY